MTTEKITETPEIRIRPTRAGDRFALARIIIGATFSAFQGRVLDKCLDWLEVEERARMFHMRVKWALLAHPGLARLKRTRHEAD